MILYHATCSNKLRSIEKYGLGGVRLIGYSLSKKNCVYFSAIHKEALGYGESSLTRTGAVVVLEIDSNVLDASKLRKVTETIYEYEGVVRV